MKSLDALRTEALRRLRSVRCAEIRAAALMIVEFAPYCREHLTRCMEWRTPALRKYLTAIRNHGRNQP